MEILPQLVVSVGARFGYDVPPGELSDGVGIRIYRNVDVSEGSRQFICVEDADGGKEAWYRVDVAELIPVSLQGLKRLPPPMPWITAPVRCHYGVSGGSPLLRTATIR